ncbi:hypothetical protein K435DRAFT_778946 [Dendrothele bispora CBS 962.96]|uniref:Uncharacterized protein n=1 Tax=Dendrothele bispora (strain CBS 962.96) TaxID=1314807 RepID=A0A4S8M0I5_DENBC|nr:hypothetical protein K435DRAFT_778946 [Dendrothele bispora CBS 962.96]
MQYKFIVAFVICFASTFVVASPVPVPEARLRLPRADVEAREVAPENVPEVVAREPVTVDVEEREPEPVCRWDCI